MAKKWKCTSFLIAIIVSCFYVYPLVILSKPLLKKTTTENQVLLLDSKPGDIHFEALVKHCFYTLNSSELLEGNGRKETKELSANEEFELSEALKGIGGIGGGIGGGNGGYWTTTEELSRKELKAQSLKFIVNERIKQMEPEAVFEGKLEYMRNEKIRLKKLMQINEESRQSFDRLHLWDVFAPLLAVFVYCCLKTF